MEDILRMNKTIALFDLDTPIYEACAVCEQRDILVTHTLSSKTKVFKNRTEFKEMLTEKNKLDKIQEYTIEDRQQAEPLSHAVKILKNKIEQVHEYVWQDETEFLISGKDNFRSSLPLPTKYKSTRSTVRPLLLSELRKYAHKHYGALMTVMEEPDDTQIWRGYEELQKGNKPVIIATDKDSKSYSKLFLFNPSHPEKGVIQIPDVGTIEVDSKNKVRAIGMKQYGLQMLIGDITDAFKPTELCKVKFGEKSALKLLQDLTTEQEILEVVVQKYKEWYPSEFTYTSWDGTTVESSYKHMLHLYHCCVRMKEHKTQLPNFESFCTKYGVNL
jgi:hypothetical protein